jgi:putative oxidoreductase
MTNLLQNTVVLTARVLLSQIFLFAGVNHLLNWNATIGHMVGKGVGVETALGNTAHVMLALAVAAMLFGGLSLLLGIRARWGAVLLILFLIPAALIFHNFWTYSADDPHRAEQMGHFLMNFGMVGGQLMVVAFGSGTLSLDAWWRKKTETT